MPKRIRVILTVTENGESRDMGFLSMHHAREFFKTQYLHPAVCCIAFDGDLSMLTEVNFDYYLKEIEEENDPERMKMFSDHIRIWKLASSKSTESFAKCLELFNENYSNVLNGKPKLRLTFWR